MKVFCCKLTSNCNTFAEIRSIINDNLKNVLFHQLRNASTLYPYGETPPFKITRDSSTCPYLKGSTFFSVINRNIKCAQMYQPFPGFGAAI
jgi:hypothetical protein